MSQIPAAVVVALVGLFGVMVTATLSYRQGQLKVAQDLQISYDKDLRERRIKYYLELWQFMERLAKYPKPDPLTYAQIRTLALSFKQWYFSGGGLFLSVKTRNHYFNLQDGIKILLEKHDDQWMHNNTTITKASLREYLDRNNEWECPNELLEIAHSSPDPDHSIISVELLAYLRKLGSTLRTSMTDDVMTRQDTILQAENQQFID